MQPSATAKSHRSTVAPSQPHYPLRLPSYRSSSLDRYHRYGRQKAHGGKVDLMQTIDYRYDDPQPNRPSFALSVVVEEDEEHLQNNLAALVEGHHSTNDQYEIRRIGIVELVIDLALAIRRRLHKSETVI